MTIKTIDTENVTDDLMAIFDFMQSDLAAKQLVKSVLETAPEFEAVNIHHDDMAVDKFAEAMKLKLAEKREEGYSGWETCSVELLRKELIKHIAYGDPVDVANFAMMLFSREEETL